MKVVLSRIFFFIAFSSFLQIAHAQVSQDVDMANDYFQKGEFDKAVVLYEKIFNKQPDNQMFYNNYLDCLVELKQYDDAEKMVRKQIKRKPADLSYLVDLGSVYQKEGNTSEAKQQYETAVANITADQYQVTRLANAFQQVGLDDYAIQTYLAGKKVFHAEQNALFDNELATIYRKKGDATNTAYYYLDLVQYNPDQKDYVQGQMQTLMQAKEYASAFETELFHHIQKQPENQQYPEMLIWYYIQQNDFASAFLQVKALDKRNHEGGDRIFQFAQNADAAGNYDAALLAYRYIISDKGKGSYLYPAARASELTTQKTKITIENNFSQNDLLQLETNYEAYFTEFGKTVETLNMLRDYANFEAKFLHNVDKAIAMLNDAIAIPTSDFTLNGYLKLDLGDYDVIKGEVWDAMLLYGQVDKTFKDEAIGEEARFKNAKLSYYMGDFEWAQAQLDILKSATAELVANDAIALSVFITDNMGLDTTDVPMKIFSRADLLLFQNKYAEALTTLDSITTIFPKNDLDDDVVFEKGRIYLTQHDYTHAAEMFEQVDSTYSFDLLADDALFQLAELYDKYLSNKDKAMELYKTILTKYKGSIFTVEARKRFRELRGDDVN